MGPVRGASGPRTEREVSEPAARAGVGPAWCCYLESWPPTVRLEGSPHRLLSPSKPQLAPTSQAAASAAHGLDTEKALTLLPARVESQPPHLADCGVGVGASGDNQP